MKTRCLVLVLTAVFGMRSAVAQKERSFEVVSVRAIPEREGIPIGFGTAPQISNGRLTWIAPAFYIVTYAHNLPAWRVSGMKPELVSFYRIEATMDPAATVSEVQGMLRAVLKERFGFTAHWDSKEANGYNLVVGKNGPKLTAAGSETAPMPAYLKGKSAEVFEGRIVSFMEGAGTLGIMGRRVPIQKLADELSIALSAFVDDRTGLSDNYYFDFISQRPGYLPSGAIDLAPPVFDVIQESLGLSLEKARRPVEYLVVDHMDKVPTDN